jgi:hypothetical protein
LLSRIYARHLKEHCMAYRIYAATDLPAVLPDTQGVIGMQAGCRGCKNIM